MVKEVVVVVWLTVVAVVVVCGSSKVGLVRIVFQAFVTSQHWNSTMVQYYM